MTARDHPNEIMTRSAAIGLLLIVASGIAVHPAYGNVERWSQPVRLSPPEHSGWFPEVTTDAAGGVHVFWSSDGTGPPAYDAVAYCQPTTAGCPNVVDVMIREGWGGAYASRSAAVVDAAGTLHLLWRRKTIICYTATSVQHPLTSENWTPLWRFGDPGAYVSIAVDPGGVLHAAWSEGVFPEKKNGCWGCADIFYSRSEDRGTTWSLPRNISNTESGSEKPHLAFGRDGTVYLVWEEGRDFYVGKGTPTSSMIIVSRDNGRTWGQPTTFSLADDTPQSIAVGVDGAGVVVVVWQQVVGNGVFYQLSTDHGQSWSDPAPLLGVAARAGRAYNQLDDYDIAGDSAGHLHLVMTGQSPAQVSAGTDDQSAFHTEWDGKSWSTPTAIFATAGAAEWPRIAIGNGNQLHVVWFERPAGQVWNTQDSKYVVWYAHATSSAPPVPPVVWPTPTAWSRYAPIVSRTAQMLVAVLIVAGVVIATRRFRL